MVAHTAGRDTVTQCGRAAALHMAQHGSAGVDARAGLDLVCQVLRMADALGDDDDEMLLAGFLRGLHLGDDVALQVVRNLRDQRYKRPHRDARVQRDVPGIAPHDLHNTAAVVALCGVAQLVDHFHRGIIQPISQLNQATEKIAQGDFNARAQADSDDEVAELAVSFNKMAGSMQSLIDKVKEDERKMRKADLRLLQEQIQPHFLYNTLDTIVWLIESNEPDEAVTMVVTLSDFFREILSKGKEFISIKEEEKHISSYLQIQEMRYRDILEYDIQLDQVIYKYQILKLTLQPVVENALYHGIKYKRAKGCIHIHGEKEGDIIRLTVRDDGVGMDEEELEQLRQQIEKPCQETEKGFGLANVNERIHMYFGPEYGMKIQSQKGKGTTVEIVIPAILEAPVEKTGNDTAKAVDAGNSVNSDANKKIESNPKQQNSNKIIEGGRPQQEETGV